MENSTMQFDPSRLAENSVLRVYITWGGFLIIKMFLMSILTAYKRTRKGAYENNEDLGLGGANAVIKKDDDVERVRRAHLNDLENCIPFLIVCGFFVLSSSPHSTVACWLIRTAVSSRIVHTIVYACYPIRQPARSICFFTCLLITLYMLIYSMVIYFRI